MDTAQKHLTSAPVPSVYMQGLLLVCAEQRRLLALEQMLAAQEIDAAGAPAGGWMSAERRALLAVITLLGTMAPAEMQQWAERCVAAEVAAEGA